MKDVFIRAKFTERNYSVIVLILGVVVATSSDAGTRLKADKALKAIRRLRSVVKKPRK